jgi:hypothetical protein
MVIAAQRIFRIARLIAKEHTITLATCRDRVVQLVTRPTCDRLIADSIPTIRGALVVWPEISVSNSLVSQYIGWGIRFCFSRLWVQTKTLEQNKAVLMGYLVLDVDICPSC